MIDLAKLNTMTSHTRTAGSVNVSSSVNPATGKDTPTLATLRELVEANAYRKGLNLQDVARVHADSDDVVPVEVIAQFNEQQLKDLRAAVVEGATRTGVKMSFDRINNIARTFYLQYLTNDELRVFIDLASKRLKSARGTEVNSVIYQARQLMHIVTLYASLYTRDAALLSAAYVEAISEHASRSLEEAHALNAEHDARKLQEAASKPAAQPAARKSQRSA